MADMLKPFETFVASLVLSVPEVPVASTVTGTVISTGSPSSSSSSGGGGGDGDLTAVAHWVRQVTAPVLFYDAMVAALQQEDASATGVHAVLELGPNPVLTRLARPWVGKDNLLPGGRDTVAWCSSLDRQGGMSDTKAVARAAGRLGVAEVRLDAEFPNRRAFPWRSPPHPLLQRSVAVGERGVEHSVVFSETLMELYRDHTIEGRNLFPGAGYIEMAVAAAMARLPSSNNTANNTPSVVELKNVMFLAPLDLEVGLKLVCEHTYGEGMELRGVDAGTKSGAAVKGAQVQCTIESASASRAADQLLSSSTPWTVAQVKKECGIEISGITERYTEFAARGFHQGQFQTIKAAWHNDDQDTVLGQVEVVSGHEHDAHYHVHPATLDGVFQLVGLLASLGVNDVNGSGSNNALVPASVDHVVVRRRLRGHAAEEEQEGGLPGHVWWARGRRTESTSRGVVVDFEIIDERGGVWMELQGFRFAVLKPQPPSAGLYCEEWVERELVEASPGLSKGGKNATMQILEVPGCERLPEGVLEALHATYVDYASALTEVPEAQSTTVGGDERVLVVPLRPEAVVRETDDGGRALSVYVETVLAVLQSLAKQVRNEGVGTVVVVLLTEGVEGPPATPPIEGTVSDGGLSMVWGLARTARMEVGIGRLKIACVDILGDKGSDEASSLASHLQREVQALLLQDDHGDDASLVLEVAYRGTVRFERRLARSSQHTIGPVVLQLPERGLLGVVVITGGLGGLGLVTAEACVELVNISKVHER